MSPTVSFEFFPPRTLPASFKLWDCVRMLEQYDPEFVSVTYGAGASNRSLTKETASTLKDSFGLRTAAHLTFAGQKREEVLRVVNDLSDAGIRDFVALRGDAPGHHDPSLEFHDTCEFIAALKKSGARKIYVAAYPDGHPLSQSEAEDIEWLKRKQDAGASAAITQFFFEAESFLRFRDRAVAKGVTMPLIPGVLPIENWQSTEKFARKCGTAIPRWLSDAFETALRDNRSDLLAISVACELSETLVTEGCEHLHFYTLNKANLTSKVLDAIGKARKSPLAKVA